MRNRLGPKAGTMTSTGRNLSVGFLALFAAVLALLVTSSMGARAGTLLVRVQDARSGVPVNGAFVQVGAAPGVPFSNN
jgi:hypothetical protein